jgi:hypothetical protein
VPASPLAAGAALEAPGVLEQAAAMTAVAASRPAHRVTVRFVVKGLPPVDTQKTRTAHE